MIPQYELELNEPQSERSVEQQNFIIHDTTPSESYKMAVPDYQLKKPQVQKKSDLVAEARARFAKK